MRNASHASGRDLINIQIGMDAIACMLPGENVEATRLAYGAIRKPHSKATETRTVTKSLGSPEPKRFAKGGGTHPLSVVEHTDRHVADRCRAIVSDEYVN